MQLEEAYLEYNGKRLDLQPDKMTFADELYVEFKWERSENSRRLRLTIHPKQTVHLESFCIAFTHPYEKTDKIFCNGYQSWTETREYAADEKIMPPFSWTEKYFKPYGDSWFYNFPKQQGRLHSWTYTYVRNEHNDISFMGSLSDHAGFTLFEHQCDKHVIAMKKDCGGLRLDHSYPAIDVILISGKDTNVFDLYFKTLNINPPTAPKLNGWTSWYHYYKNISQDIISKNAKALSRLENPKMDIVQIDDGWQEKVGDWLSVKNTFPDGMRAMSDEIHSQGMKAGLWLAPFICEKDSDIYKKHPDWILKDDNGKPIPAGYNNLWSGWFYALDFYNNDVQKYITEVVLIALQKWNYDLLKLDFLYAAAMKTPPSKTRGHVLHEAMDFLRHLIGDKWMLACGVPMSAAFGRADYCRIGADIHLKWTNKYMKWLGHRERVSTLVSLQATLSRWQLNGRAFHNDPDVFILRSGKQKLTKEQQRTVLLLNALLGNVLFNSDYVESYSEAEHSLLLEATALQDAEIISVLEVEKLLYVVKFILNGNEQELTCNLSGKAQGGLKPFETGFDFNKIEI